MTLPSIAAPAVIPVSSDDIALPPQGRIAPTHRPARAPQKAAALHQIEIAALRRDDSLSLSQLRVPALPMFQEAFSAFARGTLIQSPSGDIAVEDIQPGDMLDTSSGTPARVLWIGSGEFVPSRAGNRMPLVRIMADSFGMNRPGSFLTLGPNARILQTPPHLRGKIGATRLLTPVQQFVDGVNVIEVSPPTPVRMFHLVLDRHAAICAGGLECETFHPGVSALRTTPHAMRTLFLSMFPHVAHAADFGPLAHPRAPDEEMLTLG